MSVRVYQLAKQLGIDNKRMIQLLRERGLDVSSPSNSIPTIYADALIEEVGDKKLILENDQQKQCFCGVVVQADQVLGREHQVHQADRREHAGLLEEKDHIGHQSRSADRDRFRKNDPAGD